MYAKQYKKRPYDWWSNWSNRWVFVYVVSHPRYRDQALMLLTLAEIKLNFPENDASVDAQLGWRLQEVTLEVGGWRRVVWLFGSGCQLRLFLKLLLLNLEVVFKKIYGHERNVNLQITPCLRTFFESHVCLGLHLCFWQCARTNRLLACCLHTVEKPTSNNGNDVHSIKLINYARSQCQWYPWSPMFSAPFRVLVIQGLYFIRFKQRPLPESIRSRNRSTRDRRVNMSDK